MADQIRQTCAKTRAAEGFFNGVKFSVVHALTYAPFYAKQAALDSGRSFWHEYSIKASRASFFYCAILTSTFGMRHLVAENKELLRFDMQYNIPVLQKYPVAQDLLLYCGFSWPIGFAINYMHTGRYLRGGPTLTLLVALIIRAMDHGKGLD